MQRPTATIKLKRLIRGNNVFKDAQTACWEKVQQTTGSVHSKMLIKNIFEIEFYKDIMIDAASHL